MNLPVPKFPREAKVFEEIEAADQENMKKNAENYLGDGSVIVTSPLGLHWRIKVNEAGTLSTEQVV